MKKEPTASDSGFESGASGTEQLDLLARAECLLERLSREAEAARAEARRSELQLMLADARRGNREPLQVWMTRNDPGYEGAHLPERAEATPPERSPADAQASEQPTDAPKAELPTELHSKGLPQSAPPSWSNFLPAARGRLAARAQRLESGASVADVAALPLETLLKPPARSSNRRLRVDSPQPTEPRTASKGAPAQADPNAQAVATKSLSAKAEDKQSGDLDQGDSEPKKQQLASQQLVELAKTFEAAAPEDLQASRRYLVLRGMGGVSASIFFHVLLVILLAALTLKLPAPPASLVLESASTSATETFELSEQLDVAEPEAMSESMQTPDMAVDLAQDLNQISNSMADSLAQSLPAQSLASAAMAASNAAFGKPNPTNASFFGAAASGNCFCYVIDSSSSMKGGPWESAKHELQRSLASLKPNQRFYIIFFNQELSAIPMPGEREPAKRALYAEPENVEHAQRWIDTIRIAKGAPPSAALKYAVDLEPDAIYLLTDGVTKTDLAGFLRENNRINDLIDGEQVRVPIHAIAFFSLEGEQLMRNVAAENNGQFIYVPDPTK